jgi:hypothetical protein
MAETDKERLTALLLSWNVPFEVEGNEVTVGRSYDKPDVPTVEGYQGFMTTFKFTDAGEFVSMGAWE